MPACLSCVGLCWPTSTMPSMARAPRLVTATVPVRLPRPARYGPTDGCCPAYSGTPDSWHNRDPPAVLQQRASLPRVPARPDVRSALSRSTGRWSRRRGRGASRSGCSNKVIRGRRPARALIAPFRCDLALSRDVALGVGAGAWSHFWSRSSTCAVVRLRSGRRIKRPVTTHANLAVPWDPSLESERPEKDRGFKSLRFRPRPARPSRLDHPIGSRSRACRRCPHPSGGGTSRSAQNKLTKARHGSLDRCPCSGRGGRRGHVGRLHDTPVPAASTAPSGTVAPSGAPNAGRRHRPGTLFTPLVAGTYTTPAPSAGPTARRWPTS